MARSKYLTPEARQYILECMNEIGEITTEEVMQLIDAHFLFDPLTAREQQVRRLAHKLMAALRDESGVRKCYAVKEDKTYINIEKSTDRESIMKVEASLKKSLAGLGASYSKVKKRLAEVEGQVAFGDLEKAN